MRKNWINALGLVLVGVLLGGCKPYLPIELDSYKYLCPSEKGNDLCRPEGKWKDTVRVPAKPLSAIGDSSTTNLDAIKVAITDSYLLKVRTDGNLDSCLKSKLSSHPDLMDRVQITEGTDQPVGISSVIDSEIMIAAIQRLKGELEAAVGSDIAAKFADKFSSAYSQTLKSKKAFDGQFRYYKVVLDSGTLNLPLGLGHCKDKTVITALNGVLILSLAMNMSIDFQSDANATFDSVLDASFSDVSVAQKLRDVKATATMEFSQEFNKRVHRLFSTQVSIKNQYYPMWAQYERAVPHNQPQTYHSKDEYRTVATTKITEDFSAVSHASGKSFESQGITYRGEEAGREANVCVTPSGATRTFLVDPAQASVLTSNGKESISIHFNYPYTAVGFDTYINQKGPVTIEVLTYDDVLIGRFKSDPKQKPTDVGFWGIVAHEPITEIRWISEGGDVANTGIANLIAGSALY